MSERPATNWTRQRLGREEVGLAVARAYHGFLRHRGLDSAAALAFFAALSVFPISLSVVSTVAILDSRTRAPGDILRVLSGVAPHATVVALEGPLDQLLSIPNPGYALATGLILGLWTLSGYVTAVGRALNTAYGIDEGRRWLQLRATMLVVAAVLLVVGGAAVLLILGTPGTAASIARSHGLSTGVALAWDIAKWPVLAGLGIFAVAILYFYSPNVQHLRIRWVTAGALLAIIVWVLATTGFAIYVLNLSHYNRVYGWLGGAVVLLLWLYLSNLVVVAGAEMDAELVRVRQLRSGIHSEKEIQLPLRSTERIETLDRWQTEDQRKGLLLRRRSSK
jgi:membrane protein